jgi:hypothetical protein
VSPRPGSKGAWVMRKPNSKRKRGLLCLQKPDFDHPYADGTIPVLSQPSDDEKGTNCDQNWQLEQVGGSYTPPGSRTDVQAEPLGMCLIYKYMDRPKMENTSIHGFSLELMAAPSVCEGLEGDWNIPYYFTGPVVWVGTIHVSGMSGIVDMGVPGLVYHFAVSGSLCEIHFCVTPNVQPGSVACMEPGNFLSGRLNSAGDITWDQGNYPQWTRNSPPGPTGCPNMPFYACVKDGNNGPLNCAQAPEPSMCTAVMAHGTPPFCRQGDNCQWCDTTNGSLWCTPLHGAALVV